jgi:hypothetical protein
VHAVYEHRSTNTLRAMSHKQNRNNIRACTPSYTCSVPQSSVIICMTSPTAQFSLLCARFP